MHNFFKVLWSCTFGLILSLIYALLGLVCFVTIIGIPFAKQFFRIAAFSINPFDVTTEIYPGAHKVLQALWFIFGVISWVIAAALGLILSVTLIGIPYGKQCFRIANFAFRPHDALAYSES